MSEQKFNRQAFGSVGRNACLMAILLFELVVWGSMRWFGWNESLRLGGLSVLLILSAFPLVIAAVMLLWSWRLSIRRMLIAVTLVAIFLAAVAVPYQRFSSERHASFTLMSAGAGVPRYDSYMQRKYPLERPAPGFLSALTIKTVAWLLPSVGKVPVDEVVCELTIMNDQQLSALLGQSKRLPNLSSVELGDSVSNAARVQFVESLASFPRLDRVLIWCSNEFDSESIRGLRGLKSIAFSTRMQPPPSLPNDLGKVVSGLSGIRGVYVSGFLFTPVALMEWEDLQIEYFAIWSTRTALTKSDLCRFSVVAPHIVFDAFPRPSN